MGGRTLEQKNEMVQAVVVLIGTLQALTFNQWISLGVLVTGFVSMLITWYYKHKAFQLQMQKHNNVYPLRTKQPTKKEEHRCE